MAKPPYTEENIGGTPCCRCGKPSVSQWDCCAVGNKPMALCVECDIKLNRVALEFVGHPDIEKIMKVYAATKRALHNPKTSKAFKEAHGLDITQRAE